MSKKKFIHLHVHTDYSILDGHSTIEELIDEVERLGQPAVAITDHGTLAGVRQLWKVATDRGIKPIVGGEFYLAPSGRTEKNPIYWGRPEQRSDDISGQGAYTHITLVATSDEGIHNLFRLHATAYADGYYRQPRIDLDCLETYRGGIVATTGCAGGATATLIRLEQHDKALEYVATLRDIFPGSLYVEVMDHDNPIDTIINPSLVEISRKLELPLLATNDSHYTTPGDAYSHDALLCLQTGQRINGVRRFQFEGSGYYIRSCEEMEELFREIPDAIQNTLSVAERVEDYREVFAKRLRFPRYSEDAARDLSVVLARHPWPEPEYQQRENYEKEVIINLGFADYFMVMSDIAAMAQSRNIRIGPGRGSAGGSLVAYALGITDIDPIEHNLLFERFLNPDRVSLPDIDVDVDESRRDELLSAIKEKYGEEFVAQLGTRGTIKSKSALHDAARVLGYKRYLSDRLADRLPPPKFGRIPELGEGSWNGLSDDENEVLTLARTLEGRTRNKGVHAAGVVISPEKLADIIPLYQPKGKGQWVTEYDMNDIEEVGLVKMDYLGLKNLAVIDECLRMLSVRRETSPILSTSLSALTDDRTYRILQEGNTLGVFQLDSPGMQQLLRSIRPDNFGDISAVLALYRPGPMGVNAHHSYAKRKNGRERISYPHRELEEPLKEILGETFGLIVYQEQVMAIAREVAGYSLGKADLLRRAMGKKDRSKLQEEFEPFAEGMRKRDYSEECIQALWDTLVPFADYAFNKAHSAGYGVVSYWTAYLKANFPTEYMAALLSQEDDDKKVPVYIQEISRMGVSILPPDINTSEGLWTPTDDGIRYGLSSIKNFGPKAYSSLVTKRPFKSLDDFFRRANAGTLNARTLGALIQSGAMDSLCPDREELYLSAETLSARALADRKLARGGQRMLYSTPYTVNSTGAFNREIRQKWERELLNTTFTQQQLVLQPSRWLSENEFYYLKQLVVEYPGRQKLQLQLGYSTISIGYVDWTDKLKRQIESLGVVDVTTD